MTTAHSSHDPAQPHKVVPFNRRKRLGEAAVGMGYVTLKQVKAALVEQRERQQRGQQPIRLGLLLVEMGALSGSELADVLCRAGKEQFQITDDALRLVTRLDANLSEDLRVLLLSSPAFEPNLAELVNQVAIASALISDRPILVVDGDIHHARLHKRYDQARTPGLVDILLGNANLKSGVRRTEVPKLYLLPAGTHINNALTPLMSPRLGELFGHLRRFFGHIFVASPPMLRGSEASTLAAQADGAIVGVGANRHSREQVAETVRLLQGLNVKVLGAILCER